MKGEGEGVGVGVVGCPLPVNQGGGNPDECHEA